MDKETLAALGVVLGLPTMLQLSPIKINPWSWIWNMLKRLWTGFCRSLNEPVLSAVEKVTKDLLETKKALDAHIAVDDQREADKIRASILHFNNELMREIAKSVVLFVEQVWISLHGKEKLKKALEVAEVFLKKKGIKFDADEMTVLIEAAVAEFNEAFKKPMDDAGTAEAVPRPSEG